MLEVVQPAVDTDQQHEEGDPDPCPEDEECFVGPDSASMEEAYLVYNSTSQYILWSLWQGRRGNCPPCNCCVYRRELCEAQDPCQAHLCDCSQSKLGGVRQGLRMESAWHDAQPEKERNTGSDGHVAKGSQAQAASCMYRPYCRDGEQVWQ